MSAPVDVRVVLADYWRRLDIPEDLLLVRQAIDDLISEARRAERLLRDMADAGFGAPTQADGLRAALVRAGCTK